MCCWEGGQGQGQGGHYFRITVKEADQCQPSAKRCSISGRRRRSPMVAPSAPSMPSLSSSASTAASGNSNGGFSDFGSDTQSSSECFPTPDYDMYQLLCPASVNNSVLSPPCDATLVGGVDAPEWLPKEARNVSPDENLKPNHSEGGTGGKATLVGASCYLTPSYKLRSCPMPSLSWADSTAMWELMCRKDDLAWLDRAPNMFDKHPSMVPRMRSILLDWLSEVCEVYKMHRETYYLAVDFIDRYLSRKTEQKKTHLQLLGITALFVAAKVEEIYPPKLAEFAYVTDGACTEEDILNEELVLLSELQWNISPITVVGWLGLYMQVHVGTRERESQLNYLRVGTAAKGQLSSPSPQQRPRPEERASTPSECIVTSTTTETDDAFAYPQFSGMQFAHTAQLLDLCVLDVGITNFRYSVIAAAALSHTYDSKTATTVSGLSWEEIAPCAKWMEPFFQVICEQNAVSPLTFLESNEPFKYSHGLKHFCPKLVSDNSHIIQTHTTSISMLELTMIKTEELESARRMVQQEASPAPAIGITPEDGFLTPPASHRKSLEAPNGPYDNPPQQASVQQDAQLHPVPGHGVTVSQSGYILATVVEAPLHSALRNMPDRIAESTSESDVRGE
ncbi:G1/S-specific cyclin-E1 [Anopheles bellator]|uniref:G1/S-specific cyclin-E1 n=1 Tax=Anopheles bellator TaxID=139047 RepID=UPI002648E556|nr:G1/S-specific cyclin-E1 [Anopheles bellator]